LIFPLLVLMLAVLNSTLSLNSPLTAATFLF